MGDALETENQKKSAVGDEGKCKGGGGSATGKRGHAKPGGMASARRDSDEMSCTRCFPTRESHWDEAHRGGPLAKTKVWWVVLVPAKKTKGKQKGICRDWKAPCGVQIGLRAKTGIA